MPIAPRYTWREDEHHVRLRLERVRAREPGQVLAAGRLVKVNAPPYLLLLDLAGELADGAGAASAVQDAGSLTLTLRKVGGCCCCCARGA